VKKNSCHIVFVLDRSGSMDVMVKEAIGGFNAFVDDQKKSPGEAVMTLVQFDNEYQVVFRDVPVKDVKPLDDKTYVPRGTTALYDAVGKTITELGVKLAAMPESERPEQVILVILTDGLENASREYQLDQLKGMIANQEQVYSWKFLYLAAGMEAQMTLQNLAIDPNAQVLSFAHDGVSLSKGIASSSCAVRSMRSGSTASGWNKGN